MEYIADYDSKLGKILFASDGNALTGLWFYGQKYFADTLAEEHEERNLPVFDEVRCWLDDYFEGKKPERWFGIAPKGTKFRQQVWQILLKIPYGEVLTYGEIAKKVAELRGMSAMSGQAVGGAVGHNPISIIIPCHRVVGTNGSLTGYAGGVERKEWMLHMERETRGATASIQSR